MKCLVGIVLGMSGAIALQGTGLAQVGSDPLVNGEGMRPVVETRSELLMTDPISVNTSEQTARSAPTFRIYDTARLRQVTQSLRANPGSGGKILDVVPPDLIHTPSFPATDTRAIDFFQVPPPNPGVGINLNTQ